jgi:four helix bundle protein
MSDYRDLNAWQEAHRLALLVYRLTRSFPKDELFGLTSQFRRAAVSVAANIAEGNGRESSKEYLQFLYIARGSLNETRYFITLATDLKYLNSSDAAPAAPQVECVSKLLSGLIRAIQRKTG